MLQRRSEPASTYDAIVVGARCAGSPLATMLARSGLSVCLLDRASFPSDTPSTHGIQPPGVKVLERLGVLERLLERGARPVEDGLIAFDDLRIEAHGISRVVGAPMLNVRRIALDAALLEAAAAAGAEVRTGTNVTGLRWDGGRVTGVETGTGPLRARLVVGADGARSTVARLLGAREYHRTPGRRIFVWSYFEGVDPEERRVWLGEIRGDGFLASPTDAGLFLAAFVAPSERWSELRQDRQRGFEQGIGGWPELQGLLAGGRQVGKVRMMSRWHGYFRESVGPGWVLLGDAGHFKDPTPGQGIADALRQAEALAPAVERSLAGSAPSDEPLRAWWEWRDRDAWEMYWFAQGMGRTEQAPILMRAFQARLAADPELVDGLIRVLGHDLPPSKLFSPSLMLSVLGEAIRADPSRGPRLLADAGRLVREELRHPRKPRRPRRGRGDAGPRPGIAHPRMLSR
jgi:2-polyprenyl-6-methoxyphenol hydroxylase-like FAD-dependent oxidoreductase